MARPAGFAKQYSRATDTDTAWTLALDRAGIVTGTAACSPSCAVSCSWAWHAAALSATATCDGATKLTSSVPHSTWGGPARSGPDVNISHRPELAPDATIRGGGGGGGALALSVLVSGRERASWTGAAPERPRQPPTSATSDSNATRTTVRRNLNCRADARG